MLKQQSKLALEFYRVAIKKWKNIYKQNANKRATNLQLVNILSF